MERSFGIKAQSTGPCSKQPGPEAGHVNVAGPVERPRRVEGSRSFFSAFRLSSLARGRTPSRPQWP